MFGVIAGGIIALIEKEIANHSPEIEALVIKQLEEVAKHLMSFVSSRNIPESIGKEINNG